MMYIKIITYTPLKVNFKVTVQGQEIRKGTIYCVSRCATRRACVIFKEFSENLLLFFVINDTLIMFIKSNCR